MWTTLGLVMRTPPAYPGKAPVYKSNFVPRDHTQATSERSFVFLAISCYLGAWILFGVVVHVGDWALHRAVEGMAGLMRVPG